MKDIIYRTFIDKKFYLCLLCFCVFTYFTIVPVF